MNRLFHIVDRDVWAAAQRSGAYRPASLDSEGFVHFSFAHQVLRVRDAIYRDVPNLFVVEIDATRVGAPVRVEDSYGAGEEFPHIYSMIPAAAAVGVFDLDDPIFSVAGPATSDR